MAAYRIKFYDNGGVYNDAGIGLDGSGGGSEKMWFNAYSGFYWNQGTQGIKMMLDGTGRLGIGTDLPSSLLTLNATSGGALQWQYNGGNYLRIEADSGGGSYYAAAGFYHRFFTSGLERMRIASDGNVGIGITAPNNLLNLSKNVANGDVATYIQNFNADVGSTNETASVKFAHGNDGVVGYVGGKLVCGKEGDFETSIANIKGNLQFYTASGTSLDSDVNNIERMRISSNGNVGIGTDLPSTDLHVNSENAEGSLTLSRGGNNMVSGQGIGSIVFPADYNGTPTNYGKIVTYANALSALRGSIDFKVKSTSGSLLTGLTLYGTSSGVNVGIGTATPSNSLHILGTSDQQLKIDVTSGGTFSSINFAEAGSNKAAIAYKHSTNEIQLPYSGNASSFVTMMAGGSERIRIQSDGKVGIGITNPQDKLHVSGGGAIISSTRFGDSATASMNTTGYIVANVPASTNGQSAIVEFVASGNNGGYYNVVYSCYNGGGVWYYTKNVVGSGGNIEVAETNGSGSSTLVFYFRATSGSASYTPRVMMRGTPYALVTF